MLTTPRALHGMVTSPHHLASQAGLQILRDGGTAIEAAVACIACLAVLYPHMTGIGGDSLPRGDATATLKLEGRVAPGVLAALTAAGHDVEIVPAFSSMMGHAGAVVRHPNGVLEGASDPRSDGAVAAW